MKRKIFQVVLILVLITVGFISCAKTTEPLLPPEMSLDTDGDGFNDWFEMNIARYDPMVPNDRYIILYFRAEDMPGLVPYVIEEPTQFFVKKGKVSPENITGLALREADHVSLKNAIDQIANKSDSNDIVLLFLNGHGGYGGISGDVNYSELDKWLENIQAKAVIVVILACFSHTAIPVLKEGSSSRIILVNASTEFFSALGMYPYDFLETDTDYGNGDGYVSMGEIGNWKDNNPKWGPDWGTLGDKGRSWLESEDYSCMSDTSNIAYQIYLTDYNPALDPTLENTP